MAFVSRLANWFERVLGSLEGDDAFDGTEAEGFLMTTAEAAPTAPRARAAEPAVESPPTLGLPFAPPPAAIEPPVAVAPPGSVVPAAGPPPPEPLEPIARVPADPPTEGPFQEEAKLSDEESDQEVPLEQGDSPAPGESVGTTLIEVTATPEAKTTVVQAGSMDDMLSMFREASTGGEFQDFTKELEDVTAQEILTEARAIRDLLGPVSEEDETAA